MAGMFNIEHSHALHANRYTRRLEGIRDRELIIELGTRVRDATCELAACPDAVWVGNLYDHGVPRIITYDQVVVLIGLLGKLHESCINRPLSQFSGRNPAGSGKRAWFGQRSEISNSRGS